MPSVKYEHFCFFCPPCLVLINVDLTQAGARPIESGETMPCSGCGRVLTARLEESWMRGMMKAQAVPWDEDRKNKISDWMHNNPHPEMSEQAKFRTSMNAFKSGLHAKKHHLPPARPGRYADCKLCPFASPEFHEFNEGDGSCRRNVDSGDWVYCVKQSSLIAEWINANAAGKTEDIRNLIGDIHAQLMLIARTASDRIAIEGIMKELTYVKYAKGEVAERGVADVVLSPHFKALMDICDRLGLKLENFLLTSKSVSDKQIAESTAEHIAAIYGKRPTILDNPDPI